MKVKNVSIKGKTAYVTVWESVDADLNAGGNTGKFKAVETNIETYVLTAKGWKVKHEQTVKEHITINGKTVAG